MKNLAFYAGFALLLTHEIDAMPNHEWRGMPILGGLPDGTAMPLFVALHVPAFAALLALVASTRPRVRLVSRVGLAIFLAIHGVLHTLSMGRPTYEFESLLSRTLIFGAAACGAFYLMLEAGDRRAR